MVDTKLRTLLAVPLAGLMLAGGMCASNAYAYDYQESWQCKVDFVKTIFRGVKQPCRSHRLRAVWKTHCLREEHGRPFCSWRAIQVHR
mgnify:CR=1 FL=1